MINGTLVTIVGNLGGDPELRYTPSGNAVCTFSVAVPQRRFNKETNSYEDKGTTWYRVNVWRDLAEHAAESLIRGTRVIVVGNLESRDWDNGDGKTGTSWEITADAAGPDLTWATARISRSTRDQVPPPDDPWGGIDAQPAGNGQDTAPAGNKPAASGKTSTAKSKISAAK